MLTAVVLLTWMGVGGCEWPNSRQRMSRRILSPLVLRNNAPASASTVDTVTNSRMAHVMWIFPSNQMGFPSVSMLPRKTSPPAQLLPFPADMYDASECTLRIMSDA